MIIDFHVHCFPDELATKAISALSLCAGITPRLRGTVEDMKKSMQKAGVDFSVIQNIATKPSQTENVNNYAISCNKDNIIAFGSVHPLFSEWNKELKRISKAGLKGIKFHPEYQEFFVDDSSMFPIYEAAAEENLVILFHAGRDIGLPGPIHCTPKRLRNVIDTFPDARIVAAHLGGYDCWDDTERYLVGTNIYMDTSYTYNWISEEQLLRILNNHSPERILFGTDSPWTDQCEEVANINKLAVSQQLKDNILGLNGARLLR